MIRLATINDVDNIMIVINSARLFLRESGSKQWNLEDGYPTNKDITKDIINKELYVYDDGIIKGCICMCKDLDPNYECETIWDNDNSYVSLHRLAVDTKFSSCGVASQLIKYCIDNCNTYNVRIDTHEKNIPMINLINKLNFTYVGVITMQQCSEDKLRNAYEYVVNK